MERIELQNHLPVERIELRSCGMPLLSQFKYTSYARSFSSSKKFGKILHFAVFISQFAIFLRWLDGLSIAQPLEPIEKVKMKTAKCKGERW